MRRVLRHVYQGFISFGFGLFFAEDMRRNFLIDLELTVAQSAAMRVLTQLTKCSLRYN
jgi:hypothetical protein